jgi:ABC-type transport system involved in cytochrome c biogenesis permease subunit
MSNMGKGAGYYLTRSKSLLIDTAIVAILAIFMSFAMQMDTLQSKGEDYLVLMLYAVIFGLTSLSKLMVSFWNTPVSLLILSMKRSQAALRSRGSLASR